MKLVCYSEKEGGLTVKFQDRNTDGGEFKTGSDKSRQLTPRISPNLEPSKSKRPWGMMGAAIIELRSERAVSLGLPLSI